MFTMFDLCHKITSGNFTLDMLEDCSNKMIDLLRKKDANNEKDELYDLKQKFIQDNIQFSKFLKEASFSENLDLQ